MITLLQASHSSSPFFPCRSFLPPNILAKPYFINFLKKVKYSGSMVFQWFFNGNRPLFADSGVHRGALLCSLLCRPLHQNLLLHLHQKVSPFAPEIFCTKPEGESCPPEIFCTKPRLTRGSGEAKAMDEWPTFRSNSLKNSHKYPSLSIKLLSSLQIFIGRCGQSEDPPLNI